MVERYNDLAALNDFAERSTQRKLAQKFHDTVLEVKSNFAMLQRRRGIYG